jgi:hypothetical protein
MANQTDVKVRMLKPAIVRFGGGDDNAPVLKIPAIDPESQRPTELTVRKDVAVDWVETGIAEYIGKAPVG